MARRSSGAPCGGMGRSRPVPCSKMVWRIRRAQTVKGKSSAAMELVTRSISQTCSAGGAASCRWAGAVSGRWTGLT